MQQQPSRPAACGPSCMFPADAGQLVCLPGGGGSAARALQERTRAAKAAASFPLSERPAAGGPAFYPDWDEYELDCAVKVRPVDPASVPW